jgi:L-lactate dehydrogenase (cytochrome)
MTKRYTPVTSDDFQRLAEKRLPTFLYDYITGGANDELTLAANIADFRKLLLKQQVMRDVSSIDTSTVLAGQHASMPLALAPVGMAGMMARRGEVQGARAAEKAGVPFTCSTVGVCSVEEIKAATSKPFWFQLYMLHNRNAVQSILERAKAAGCGTLLFTVDLAVPGMRHRDRRNAMDSGGLPMLSQIISKPRWALDVGLQGKPHSLGNLTDVVPEAGTLDGYKAFIDEQFDPSATWKDIAWLRSVWGGKLLIKGVMEADDALAAIDAGADGVVVSNHGGRQLDSVASSISKLPEVVAAIGDRAEVYMDSGVRSGLDVVKAVALGANGVLIGRPWVWAVAGGKEAGLTDLLNTFQKEIAVALTLLGVNSISDLHAGLLETAR